MRFGFLVALVVAGGAVMGGGAQFLLDPSSPSVAAGQGHGAKFDIADLNPIRLIYDAVMKQVTTDANSPSFAVGTPAPETDFPKADSPIKLNSGKFPRGSGDIGSLPETAPQ